MDMNNNDSLDALGVEKINLSDPGLEVTSSITYQYCLHQEQVKIDGISFLSAESSQWSYNMTHSSRGRCIVINNKLFDDPELFPLRTGTEVDVRSIRATFERLGFTVLVHSNQSSKEMENIIEAESQMNHSDNDCLAVVILSHGSDGVVFGRDGKTVSIDQLVRPLKGGECRTLVGKPKLFFIQACRGEQIDHGVDLDVTDGKDEVDSCEQPIRLPLEADTLFSYSTTAGYYSYKSPANGSYFIQSLCRMLDQHAHQMDLLKILTRVLNDVAVKFESKIPSQQEYHKKKQMPAILSMLRKELYLTPKDDIVSLHFLPQV